MKIRLIKKYFSILAFAFLLNGAAFSTSLATDITTWFWRTAVVTTIGLSFATNPFKAEQVGVSFAYALEDVWTPRLFIRWDWGKYYLGKTQIKLVGELAFERWQSIKDPGEKNGVINAVILTPVFQVKLPYEKLHTFFEASIGATLISKYKLPANGLNFGTYFQFADSLGFGFKFGWRDEFELSGRFRHYSNNGIAYPNNGINFFDVAFSYTFLPPPATSGQEISQVNQESKQIQGEQNSQNKIEQKEQTKQTKQQTQGEQTTQNKTAIENKVEN